MFDDVEDHIRPVTRRYISGPVQKKIMNDCWDMGRPEEWFQVCRGEGGCRLLLVVGAAGWWSLFEGVG